ncbi:MAG: DUF547 domain-containing protein [Rhodospirillaceae bacterium]|jgi:hypothetical protein|nr:DUF547 domain-containing protein [Rhodospirillaceae bacterium]
MMLMLLAPLAAVGSTAVLSAPRADLWPLWEAHDPASTRIIDHARWTKFLQRHVHTDAAGVNRVAYARIPETDRHDLAAYLSAIAAAPVSTLRRAEQRAFWINLYNALTVTLILDHYPVASIRDIDISPGLFADGPWDKALVTVEGVPVSLNDIEHRILRPIWRDPRLHYALNCASVGCPNLQRRAFTTMNAPSLLDRAARDFVNSPRGARLEGDQLTVSSLYVWFVEDFGGGTAGVVRHLKEFAAPDLAAALDDVTEIEDAYDWSLNDAAPQ